MSEGFPRDRRNADARSWHGNIPMGHKYTMGVAGAEFFKRLRDKGEITATLHKGADTPSLPPRLYDPETFAPIDEPSLTGDDGCIRIYYRRGKNETNRHHQSAQGYPENAR